MFDSLFLLALNRLLRDAGWAREQLAAFAGHPVRFELPPLSCDFAPDVDGYCQAMPGAFPEVCLSLPADAPFRLLHGWQAVAASVHIRGNAEYAQRLAHIFRHLRWDAEEDLSRLLGDILAHRLVGFCRGGQAQARDILVRLAANAADYLAHESHLLVGKAEFDAHRHAVNAFAQQLNRFDHRLHKLSTTTTPRRSP